MKKVILLILVSVLLLVAFTSCAKINSLKEKIFGKKECAHVWTEATCTTPKTCSLCGVTEGTVAKHKVADATCTTPEMCTVCGFTTEYWLQATGHDWLEASCLKKTAKTCRLCGLVEGDVPDHTWSTPTCLDDSYCEVCNLTNPNTALGHDRVVVDAIPPTCTEVGYTEGEKCSRCGDVEEGKGPQVVPALEHNGFEVEIPGTPATCDTDGLSPGKQCSKCGEITEKQIVIEAFGHQRYKIDDQGNVTDEQQLVLDKVVAPTCLADGKDVYKCYTCGAEIEVAVPKVDHKYPLGATCDDPDAVCEYCGKNIEHEFLAPTCTAPATCRICNKVDDTRPALNHVNPELGESAMLPATCHAPATCSLCGYTEGDKLIHELTFSAFAGDITYSCVKCDTSFTLQDEAYYLDGTNHDYIVPVNNKVAGYDTHLDDAGEPTNMPKIVVGDDGDSYYSLIKVKEPEFNDKGEQYPPQVQLWIPMQRNGFTGFSSQNSAVGFISFSINAYMDKNFGLSLLEGAQGWDETVAISNIFNIIPPSNGTVLTVTGIDDGDSNTPAFVLFEKDLAGAATVQDKFTGWLDVYIGLVLDDATDTISYHYYINGIYKGSVTTPLKTVGNSIKCAYFSGNTNEMGGGVMLDDIAFGYTAVGNWVFNSNHEHVYDLVSEEVAPTCTSDGYRIYACACGDIGTRISFPALGHHVVSVDELLPTCTEPGHSAYSYCSREECGMEFAKMEVYSATGHDYETKAHREPTCTSGGFLNQTCKTCGAKNQVSLEKLGHIYSLSGDCDLGGTCERCGVVSSTPIGHDFAPATCTEPATCRREGCNETTGEPLGHNFADPTCTVAPTCTVCQHVEGYKLPHNLAHKYVKSVLHYYCTDCGTDYAFDTGYTLNGVNHNYMVVPNGIDNASNFTVAPGTNNPSIVDGHYEFINKSGNRGQFQVWIPNYNNPDDFGFSSKNRAIGFFSFKMNANVDSYISENVEYNGISIKLVDGLSNNGDDRWTRNGIIGDLIINPLSSGYMTLGYKHITDAEQTAIHSFAAGADGYTGWVDVKLGMEFNPDSDQVTYHFYINGEYVTSFSKELTTKTNSINAVYISGYTAAKGTGIMLDDIAFGYTALGEWIFDGCNHEGTPVTVAPTCTEDGYTKTLCTKCGHIEITDVVDAFGHTELEAPDCTHGSKCVCGEYYGEALGHTGGTATCTEKPVCDRCGEEYGSPSHDIVEATCGAASYCKACGEEFGEAVSHCPVATLVDETVTYSCKYCGKTYVLEKNYYHDGETSVGAILPTAEDTSYNGCNTDNGDYSYTLQTNAVHNGKGWVWVPTNGTGINDFEGFTTGAVGVLSFSADVYTDKSFQVHFIDSDYRSGGPAGSFWEHYSMQSIFAVSTPDKSNVVTLKAFGGEELLKITVDENKHTGMFDVTIGIEMLTGGKIALHYYINGQYVKSITPTFSIASGKIDGVTFLGECISAGAGYTVDNIVFGYAKPYGENPAPVKPE